MSIKVVKEEYLESEVEKEDNLGLCVNSNLKDGSWSNVLGPPKIESKNSNTRKTKHDGEKLVTKKYLLPFIKIKRNLEIERAVKAIPALDSQLQKPESNIYDDCEKYIERQQCSKDVTGTVNTNGSETVVMFVCGDCNECFQERINLEGHTCVINMNSSNSSESLLNSSSFGKKSTHVCKSCGSSFRFKYLLLKHAAIHDQRFYCETCKQPFGSKKLLSRHCREHLGLTISKPIPCDHCNLVFKTKTEFTGHMTRVNGGRDFSCDHCKKAFKCKSSVKYHIVTSHIQDHQKYSCDKCSKSFPFKTNLNGHKSKVHSGLRPLKCHLCGDTFKWKECLTIHIKGHSGVKTHSCSFCGKQFAQRAHLVRHERLHTGVKPYVCDVCNKSFRDSSNFKVHQRSHTGLRPFKCDQCEKSFTQSSHLTTHKKSHSDERTLSCDICNKSFKERMSLTSHVLLHSNVKPFNCKVCGKSFVQGSAFKRHKCLNI